MHKHTRICTYMHMFICTHVYLFTQIFLCTRVHARVCTHTQKTDLWITEYPKALPRNGVKFKKPSYTQKRLGFFGGGSSGAMDNRKRQKEYNAIFSQGKQSPFLKLPEERILPMWMRSVFQFMPWSCYHCGCDWKLPSLLAWAADAEGNTDHHPHKCSTTFGVASKMEARYQILCQFLWNDKTENTWKLFKHLTNFISTTKALKLNSGFWNRLFSDLRIWKMCGDKEVYADLGIEVWTAVQAWYS